MLQETGIKLQWNRFHCSLPVCLLGGKINLNLFAPGEGTKQFTQNSRIKKHNGLF